MRDYLAHTVSIMRREKRRLRTPYPPALLSQIKEARREKIRNKTRERQRQLLGESLPVTKVKSAVVRMRRRAHAKGPPAHILQQMSPHQRRMDRIRREPSEGGYSGLMKAKLGMKIPGINDVIEREEGKAENHSWLKDMETNIRDANRKKKIQ